MPLEVKTYSVAVSGFETFLLCARTRGKACAKAWQLYQSYDDRAKFRDFLRMAHVTRVVNPPGVGERIIVAGLPATRVIHYSHGHYVAFMRDGCDDVLFAHPADVEPATIAASPRRTEVENG